MKNNILWILLDSVFLTVFNTIFFVAGGSEHTSSVWISYAFIHFSYIMTVITPFLTRKCSKTGVLGFTLSSVSSAYFFFEFVVGLIFILIGSKSYKPALLTQIVIAGIYSILLLANMIANEHTADSMIKHKDEVMFIKDNSSKLQLLLKRTNDKMLGKELEKTYDLLHSSPAKSNDMAKSIEADVSDEINKLENLLGKEDYSNAFEACKSIIALIKKRNEVLKNSD